MVDEKLEEDMAKASTENEKIDVEQNRFWALLSYLGILVIIPLLIKKDSAFCQFHARQGLVLLFGWILSWFPILGWVVGILVFILSVIGIVNVINGEKKNLPFIGELTENLNI